ncbi:Protein YeeZ [Linum perenne]
MEICRLPARVLPGTSPVLFTKRTFPAATASPSPSQSANLAESRMFMLGTGYVGQFFGQQLHRQGWVVKGTCTSMWKNKELEEKGFDAFVFDANEPELSVLQSLKSCTHLLVSIPSLAGLGDPLLKHQHLLRDALIDGSLQWLCYLSSTGVYGDCLGALVNEDYPASPSTEVAKARLLAENGWLNFGHSLGLSTQVFRLGGIYGPGRSAVDTVMKQKPLSERQKMRASGQYTSRVHVEDICQALWASIKIPSFRRIYNIVDDDPAPREEVFAYAEDLVKKKWPDLIKQRSPSEEDMSSDVVSQRSSRGEKRVSNTRMKRELGVKLHHPSYRSGLISITEQLSL